MTTGNDTDSGSQIVDATVVDEPPGTALATQELHGNLFNTDDPVEVVERAARVANALRDVIEQRQLYENIKGKQHVRVEGWQLLGSMLGITAVCTDTQEVDGGWKATVEARTLDGRVVGRADALCTRHEKGAMWKGADDYARLSMAQTRATSKALKGPLGFVVSLAGYSSTPREEMGDADEVAETPVTGKAGDAAAGNAADERRITAKQARNAAQAVEKAGLSDDLARAISHVTKRNAPVIENKGDMVEALGGLTSNQLVRIHRWVDKKTAEAGGEVAA